MIYVGQIEIGVRGWNLFWHVSLNVLQPSNPTDRARPSMRKPASREITSTSVELFETEVCFLHIELNGTNV